MATFQIIIFFSSKASYSKRNNYNLCFEGFCTSSVFLLGFAFAPLFNGTSFSFHFLPKIQTCPSAFHLHI
jgi:hypothetical protein